jgi:hypothetical protein
MFNSDDRWSNCHEV